MRWFSRAPPRSPANPGRGPQVHAAFSNAERSWEESADLLEILHRALRDAGIEAKARQHWLEVANGVTLEPQFVSVDSQPSGVRTVTTIQVCHPRFPAPGFFEYQHAIEPAMSSAFSAGFRSWLEIDWPVIADALRGSSLECMMMSTRRETQDGTDPARERRVLMGPVSHLVQRPAGPGEEAHPFCPCCLTTQSFEAFRPLFDASALQAIRLFAARTTAGEAEADCRVNGEEYGPGREALLRYVATWPDRGVEFRKQFVIMQTVDAADPESR